ncbi:hypothetical protein FHU42_002789 [Corynebacterium glutamicum]|nr:hypothetical protein [Corynebacterium glutamicum]
MIASTRMQVLAIFLTDAWGVTLLVSYKKAWVHIVREYRVYACHLELNKQARDIPLSHANSSPALPPPPICKVSKCAIRKHE